MKDSDKKILLALLAVAILALTYMYVFRTTKTDCDNLKVEIDSLQARYDDLCQKNQYREQYLAEIDEFNAKFAEELTIYPADLNQETTVMFMKGIENQFEFVNRTIGLSEDRLFYVLGQGAVEGGAAVISDEDSDEVPYNCYQGTYPISFTGKYDDFKAYLNYIASYKYRMNISNFTVTYNDELDEVSGNVNLYMYAVSGPDRTPETVDVDVPNGVSNIFVGGNGAVANKTYAYDADNGAAIATTSTMTMLLNNANSDAASGIIVAAKESDSATYVTSEANEVANVTITVYSQDGKNFVSYEIGDKSYETEVLTSDVTVYVKSSARTDGEDKNGVNVTVSNTTSLPVFFKVADDDATSPRFKIASKSGVVKVY